MDSLVNTSPQIALLFACAAVLCFTNLDRTSAAPQFPERVIGKAGSTTIHATEVIQPIYKDLIKVAASTNKEAFVNQATRLLTVRVYSITYSRLVAHDMLQRMTITDRNTFEGTIARQKSQLIKEWGSGDAGVADQQLRKERGMGLEQIVINAKTNMLVQEFQKALQKRIPAITDAQVDEFYKANNDKFNVDDQRHIRLIQVEAKDKAAIAAALQQGKAFADVAKSPTNLFRADRGGDMGEVPGKKIFGDENLNKATLALKAGESSPPIDVDGKVWWVHVEKVTLGQMHASKEQRDAIRKQILTQQFTLLERHYRSHLFKTVEHTKMEDMVLALQPYLLAIFETANDR